MGNGPFREGRWSWESPCKQGVARELLEETGLEVQVLDMIEAFDRIFLDPAAAKVEDKSRPKYHYVIVDYLCERLAGEAQAGSDVTDLAFATEGELEKFQMTSTAMRVLRRAFAMDRERRNWRYHCVAAFRDYFANFRISMLPLVFVRERVQPPLPIFPVRESPPTWPTVVMGSSLLIRPKEVRAVRV